MGTEPLEQEALPQTLSYVAQGDVPSEHAAALRRGAVVGVTETTVLGMVGPGAVQSIQGLLTNDIVAPGPHGFVYGAVLTPKGTIISDLWVARSEVDVTLFAPEQAKADALAILHRYVPPRLARTIDRTDEHRVLRLTGPEAASRASSTGIVVPEAGRVARTIVEGHECLAARPSKGIPFALLLSVPRDGEGALCAALDAAGVTRVGPSVLEVARVLAGWPRLGSEIGPRTLPQEVRFDEIDGVSYTKGCYTGQETVARLHFRGHTNRWLGGLMWDDTPDRSDVAVLADGRPVGQVTSIAWVPDLERFLGLGLLRREIAPDVIVTAAGHPAHVVTLPFPIA